MLCYTKTVICEPFALQMWVEELWGNQLWAVLGIAIFCWWNMESLLPWWHSPDHWLKQYQHQQHLTNIVQDSGGNCRITGKWESCTQQYYLDVRSLFSNSITFYFMLNPHQRFFSFRFEEYRPNVRLLIEKENQDVWVTSITSFFLFVEIDPWKIFPNVKFY